MKVISRKDVRRVFCTNCFRDQAYRTEKSQSTVRAHGRSFPYTKYSAYCEVCGAEVHVKALNDMNTEARKAAYRKEGTENGETVV